MTIESKSSNVALENIQQLKQGVIKYNQLSNQIMFDDFLRNLYNLNNQVESNQYIEIDKLLDIDSHELTELLNFVQGSVKEDYIIDYKKKHIKIYLTKTYNDTRINLVLYSVTNNILDNKLNPTKNEHQEFHQLAISAGELMVYNFKIDKGTRSEFIYCNQMFLDKLGIKFSMGQYITNADYQATKVLDEEGKSLNDASVASYFDTVNQNIGMMSNHITKHKNVLTKEILYLKHSAKAGLNGKGEVVGFGGFMEDVTDQILATKKLTFIAERDLLTGLYNRNYYEKFIDEFNLETYSVMIFDIDGLKLTNDAFGHSIGDEILKDFSRMLRKVFINEKNIFRIGGDEFVIISKEIDSTYYEEKKIALNSMIIEHCKSAKGTFLVSVGFKVRNHCDYHYNSIFITAENEMYREKLANKSIRKKLFFNNLTEQLFSVTEESELHCERIGNLAKKVLIGYGWMRTNGLDDIYLAAKFHDIGKLTIDHSLLMKSGELSSEEYNKVKSHSEAGYRIIENILDSDEVSESILYHHERYDGLGYPHGLVGDDIPLFARIISICDTFETMTKHKTYKKAISIPRALAKINESKYKQFDPDLADIFIDIIEKEQENQKNKG